MGNQIDYLSSNFKFAEDELDSMPKSFDIELSESLEKALDEIEALKGQLSAAQTENLLTLCKDTVLESIVGQFGLGSIILNPKDGGNVTTIHNFEKGIVATDSDAVKYNAINNYDRKASGYDKVNGETFNKKRKGDFQKNEVIIDGYTGKPLAKDGTTHLDHIVSAKEIETNPALNFVATPEERARIATQPENLTYTRSGINQSKSDAPLTEWENKVDPKTGQSNAEKYGIDRELAEKKDAAARAKIESDTAKLAAKKYTEELFATGAKDAANSAAVAILGFALRDLVSATFTEIHITFKNAGDESLKEIFVRFKTSIEDELKAVKDKWKDLLSLGIETAITSFLSHIVVFIINLFATTLKKVVAMIRAGFVSLSQAVKILVNPPADMPKEEVGYQAVKILTAGLIGSLSLGLSAAIEKLLQAVPGLQPLMLFPIPIKGQTVSDVLATTLSAIAGGLLTTIALYFMDKFHNSDKALAVKFRLVTKTGIIPQYTLIQTYKVVAVGYQYVDSVMGASDSIFYEMLQKTEGSIIKHCKEKSKARKALIDSLRSEEE